MLISHPCLAGQVAKPSSRYLSRRQELFYMTKKHDSLNKILRSFGIRPAWGSGGAVEKLLLSNPALQEHKKKADFIYPREKIQFDSSFTEVFFNRRERGIASISESGEINFICSDESLKQWALIRHELEPDVDPFDKRYPTLALDCKQEQPEVSIPALASEPAAVAPAPLQPMIQEVKSNENLVDSHMEFSIGSGHSKISSTYAGTSSNANILSQSMQEVMFRWEQHWSERQHSFIEWNNLAMSYVGANIGTLNNGTQQISNFSFGGNYRFSDQWVIETQLGLHGYVFAPSYAAGSVNLEVKPLPYAQVQFLRDLVKVRSLTLKGGGGLVYTAPSTEAGYNIGAGSAYYGLLRIEQQLKSFGLFTEGQYEYFNQSTSFTSQTTQELWGRMGVRWDL